MADSEVADLTAVTDLDGTELLHVVQTLSKKATAKQIAMMNFPKFNIFPSRGAGSTIGLTTHAVGRDTTIAALSTAWMTLTPLIVPRPVSIAKIDIGMGAGSAGTSLGVALYEALADHAPGPLHTNFGTIPATASSTVETFTLGAAVDVEPGLYWVAHLPSSTTPTFRGTTYTNDYGFSQTSATLIRSGTTFRVNTSIHSISYWTPPADLSSLETIVGKLEGSAMHVPITSFREA